MSDYEATLSDKVTKYLIPENDVDRDSTSIALIGHGQPNYGLDQNENFLHVLEHFASDTEPTMPIRGQIWFKVNDEDKTFELKLCKKPATRMNDDGTSDAEWSKLLISSSGSDAPTNPATGDIWYDSESHQFKIYDSELEDPTDPNSGWNTIGPKDVEHNETENTSFESNKTNPSRTFKMSKKLFARDIYNSEEEEQQARHTGSLHLVTLKVLIKEVPTQGSGTIDTLRACAMIYRFTVRTVSSGSTSNPSYSVSIFGAPNYEIISKSDNLEFTTNLEVRGGDVVFTINNESTKTGTYFVNGIDMEITRV